MSSAESVCAERAAAPGRVVVGSVTGEEVVVVPSGSVVVVVLCGTVVVVVLCGTVVVGRTDVLVVGRLGGGGSDGTGTSGKRGNRSCEQSMGWPVNPSTNEQ